MATYYGIATIPSASVIDYGIANEVCGHQLLRCKIFERAGGIDYPSVTNAAIGEAQREGWIIFA